MKRLMTTLTAGVMAAGLLFGTGCTSTQQTVTGGIMMGVGGTVAGTGGALWGGYADANEIVGGGVGVPTTPKVLVGLGAGIFLIGTINLIMGISRRNDEVRARANIGHDEPIDPTPVRIDNEGLMRMRQKLECSGTLSGLWKNSVTGAFGGFCDGRPFGCTGGLICIWQDD